MFDVKQCSFICFFYFGVIWDRRINVSFTPLCWLKWKSPCNKNSLNALWMLGTDFCAWVQTWLGPREPQSCWKNMPITNSIWYVVCSVQFSCSVMSDFCNPMNYSTPGFAVLHQLLELGQTHVHRDGDSIQPSHLLSSSSPPAFNLSQ